MAAISYREYSQQALYGESGYYRAARTRVGYEDGDFFTASSLKVFPKLMAEALREISKDLNSPTLIELACEPGKALWPAPPVGFGASSAAGLGQEIKLPTDSPCVIFANELLDAFAFGRFEFRNGAWQELGVDLQNKKLDCPLGLADKKITRHLPAHAEDGTRIDFAPAALEFVEDLCARPWQGLLILADYGMSTAELLSRPPTARAYQKHRLLSLAEALELPLGSYDITHHVPWEMVAQILSQAGLQVSPPQTQESFLIHHAQNIFPSLDQNERRQLATLTHPANMGEKFQILVAEKS